MEKRVRLQVEGMTCQSCANTITGFLKREPGVKKAKIRFKDGGGVVVFDPDKTSEERILKNSIFASGIYRARGGDVRYAPSTHRGHDILTPPAIYQALRTALAPPRYRALVIGLFALLLLLYAILIPAYAIPGNDPAFQASIVADRPDTLISTGAFSLLFALQLTLAVYYIREARPPRRETELGKTGAFGAVAAFGTLMGSATCASCIGLVFGFLGVPAAFFIINYRPHLALAGVAVMVASLHLTSRSILRRCSLPGSQ